LRASRLPMLEFTVKIDGENVTPESVSIDDLLFTLSRFRDAIVAAAVDAGQAKQKVFLSLPKITRKCTLLTFHENEAAHAGTDKVSRAIRLRDFSIIPPISRRALKELWVRAGKRNWTYALQNGEPEALIDPVQGPPTDKYIKGKTSMLAYVIRVGGAEPRVLVRLPGGERRTFRVATPELAQQIRIYQKSVLSGDAKWFRGSRKLADFKVTRVGPFNEKTADPAAAMRALSDVMGHHWDGVDADVFLQEERTDG
jgi:hypothetical protein